MNEVNNGVKQKNSKGLIILIVILVIAFISLAGYIVYDKINNNKCDKEVTETKKDNISTKENENIKEEKNKEIEDNNEEELLKQINTAYENAYNYINSGIDITTDFSNQPELKSYFTDKAINRISKNNGMSIYSILSSMDQGKRPLTIVSYTDDTVIVKGQLVKGNPNTMYDADEYPLYIIFKKENNTYKIDMFE